MLRLILGILVGVVAAFGIVYLVESLGHQVYPLPEGIDMTNPDQVGEYIKQAPVGMFLFVLAAWVLASIIGGLIAVWIARKLLLVFVIGGLILLASAVNLFMIPHPVWFMITAVVVLIFAMYVAKCLAKAVFRLP